MFSLEVRDRIAKGDKIPADWLNEIADAVIERLIGGKDVLIQRVGKRIIISMRQSQIVPKT